MAVQFAFPRNSPEAVELTRLECVQQGLQALGLCASITWKTPTFYAMDIFRGRWPFRKLVQRLCRQMDPTMPPAEDEWCLSTDCWTSFALTSLYWNALECAIRAHEVELPLTPEIVYAASCFNTNIALKVHAFPVSYQEEENRHVFTVVSGRPLTDEDHRYAGWIWPSVVLERVSGGQFSCLERCLNFLIDLRWRRPSSPYVEFCAHVAGDPDSWDSPGCDLEE